MATLSTNQNKLQQLDRRRQLAAAMQQQAMDFAPIQHPYQGLAKLAQAWAAGRINKSVGREEEEMEKARTAALAEILKPNVSLEASEDPVPIRSFERSTQEAADSVRQDLFQIGHGTQTTETNRGNYDQATLDAVKSVLNESRPEGRSLGQLEPILDREVETPKSPNQLLAALAQINPELAEQVLGGAIQSRLTATPDTTTDITEWRTAQKEDGFPGSLADWKSLFTQGVGNIPRASPGYHWVPGKEGYEEEFNKGGPHDPALSDNVVGDSTKMAAIETSLWALGKLTPALFDENGSVNRTNLWAMNSPGGGIGYGATLNSYMLTAMEAALRAETGAAAPDPEMIRIAHRFRPKITDTAATVRAKLALLDRFMSGAYNKANKSGRFNTIAYIAEAERELDEYEERGTIAGEPAYKAAHELKNRVTPTIVKLGQRVWGDDGREYIMTDGGPVLAR